MTVADLGEQAEKRSSGFHHWNDYAVERETAEFLRGLVVATKPLLVVESGTGEGYATRYMADGLLKNGVGGVVTFEINEPYYTQALTRFDGLPVTVRHGVASDDIELLPDLVFIDCVSDLREKEITYWLTHPAAPLIAVHDAQRPYPFHLGEGVHLPGYDGLWLGRARPSEVSIHSLPF